MNLLRSELLTNDACEIGIDCTNPAGGGLEKLNDLNHNLVAAFWRGTADDSLDNVTLIEPPHGYPQPCSATPDAGDTTAPSLTGAQVDGETITLEFDEAICGDVAARAPEVSSSAAVGGVESVVDDDVPTGTAEATEAAEGVSGLDAVWAVEAEQPTPRDEPVLPGPPAEVPPEGGRDLGSVGGGGVPYTYWDGNEQRTVWLQPDSPSGERGESSRGDGAAGSKPAEGLGRVEDRGRADGELVFRSESGSEMRLPGGVIVLLDPEWSAAQTAGFFTGNKIEAGLVSDFEPFENGFFVDTEPGLASLTLANSFVGQPGVVLSSPNWEIELITK